jgi:hypothetical protein
MSDADRYVLGPASPRRSATATFEFKAPSQSSRGGRGGGYPRWRSWEFRPESVRQSKEDVYVPVHRLAAVAWCLPDGTLGEDVTLDALAGMDVHHELGMPAATVGESPNWDEVQLSVLGHGEHSSVTQSEMRAYGEDAKRDVESEPSGRPSRRENGCANCGDERDVLAESADWTGRYCLPCAKQHTDGATIEIV